MHCFLNQNCNITNADLTGAHFPDKSLKQLPKHLAPLWQRPEYIDFLPPKEQSMDITKWNT